MPRRAIPFVMLGVAGWLTATPAGAHAVLMDSQPVARASAAPGPAKITLRFNSRIDHARSRLTLRTGQADTLLVIQADSPADTLAAVAALQPGDHVIRWQVLAIDGHVTRGDIPFHVTRGDIPSNVTRGDIPSNVTRGDIPSTVQAQ